MAIANGYPGLTMQIGEVLDIDFDESQNTFLTADSATIVTAPVTTSPATGITVSGSTIVGLLVGVRISAVITAGQYILKATITTSTGVVKFAYINLTVIAAAA